MPKLRWTGGYRWRQNIEGRGLKNQGIGDLDTGETLLCDEETAAELKATDAPGYWQDVETAAPEAAPPEPGTE